MKIHGTTYKPGCIVVTAITHETPEFSQVIDILMDKNRRVYFALQRMVLPEFCKHYHAYVIKHSPETDVFIGKQSDFIDYHPYYTHQTFNAIKDYIVLKYYIGV